MSICNYYIIFSSTQKTPIKGALKERKEEIRSEIDFSLSFSGRLDNWGFASVRAFVECLQEMARVDQLASERSKAQFDVDEMKIVWAGSRHAYEISDRISRLVASDPVIFLHFFFFLKNYSFDFVWILRKCNKHNLESVRKLCLFWF